MHKTGKSAHPAVQIYTAGEDVPSRLGGLDNTKPTSIRCAGAASKTAQFDRSHLTLKSPIGNVGVAPRDRHYSRLGVHHL